MVRAPLTGLLVPADSAFLARPALAAKIENTPDARPQAGLEAADIVYEEVVEGGITRFIAIFNSRDAATLGPVRSARPEDPGILREYRALFAYSGAASYVIRLVKATPGIGSIRQGEAAGAYHRVGYRAAPHNLYSSTGALWRAGARKRLPPASAEFDYAEAAPPLPSPSPPPSAEVLPGTRLTVDFSSPTFRAVWRYDPAKGVYLRSHAARPHLVASGAQVQARNVLVLLVKTQSAGNLDPAHRSTPVPILVGSGKVILFRDGVRIPGRWSRPSLDARTVFTTAAGEPLELGPGNTWVELTPAGTPVSTR